MPSISCIRLLFQSTPPVRGATSGRRACRAVRADFNPRPPCGERPPCWAGCSAKDPISIHAPRAGSDRRVQKTLQNLTYFNPRPPCGERRQAVKTPALQAGFQSTPPVRGATRSWSAPYSTTFHISIHAPRAGSDQNPCEGLSVKAISIHAPRAGSDAVAAR